MPHQARQLWQTHSGPGPDPDSLATASPWKPAPACFLPFLIFSLITYSPFSFHASPIGSNTQSIFPAVISATLDKNLILSSPLLHI